MELRNNYVWWNENENDTLHGTIKRIEPINDIMTGKQKKSKNGTTVSRIVLQTNDGDVYIRILDSQRTFFEPQLGKTGNICHDYTNNYLTFEEDYDDYPVVREPLSIEDLFPVEEEEDALGAGRTTLDKVEEYVYRINDLLNKELKSESDPEYITDLEVSLMTVQKANIETAKQILNIRMRDAS